MSTATATSTTVQFLDTLRKANYFLDSRSELGKKYCLAKFINTGNVVLDLKVKSKIDNLPVGQHSDYYVRRVFDKETHSDKAENVVFWSNNAALASVVDDIEDFVQEDDSLPSDRVGGDDDEPVF